MEPIYHAMTWELQREPEDYRTCCDLPNGLDVLEASSPIYKYGRLVGETPATNCPACLAQLKEWGEAIQIDTM